MILYIGNPKDFTKKLLGIINEFGKTGEYKISIQKSVVLQHTENKLSEKERKKTSFKIVSKTIQYLWINLSKKVKDLYTENCKTLMKEMEEDINSWKDISCSWIGIINIVKNPYYPKPSIDSIQSLSKFQWHFSQR